MPTLYDLLGSDPQGGGFGDVIAQNRNSLVGLGLGLASGGFQGAMQGYGQGSTTDAATAYRLAQMKQHQQELAFRKSEAERQAGQWQQQFARGDVTDAQRAYKDIYGDKGTPEDKQAFFKQYYAPKTEGDWGIQTDPYTNRQYAFNKRTQETRPITPPGAAAPSSPFVAGGGGVPYSPGGLGPAAGGAGGFAPSTVAPTPPSGQAVAGPAPTAEEIPLPPPGSDPAEWRKEQTKLLVQKRQAQQQAGGLGANVASEDVDRAINVIQQNPKSTTGLYGKAASNIPQTSAFEVSKLIDTIKANASLDRLQQMRANSPTGASGLGQVTQQEHLILQNAIGNLDLAQTPEQLLYNLDRVKRIRHEIIHGPGTAPPPQFELPKSQQPPAAGAGGRTGGAGIPGVVKWGRDEQGNPVRLP